MAEVRYIDPKDLCYDGYLQEANRRFFHPLGLALEVDMETGIIRCWDYRDDAEGIRYEDVDLEEKAARLRSLERDRVNARKAALGYWIQPTK